MKLMCFSKVLKISGLPKPVIFFPLTTERVIHPALTLFEHSKNSSQILYAICKGLKESSGSIQMLKGLVCVRNTDIFNLL